LRISGGIFDYDIKKERLEEVELELSNSEIWNNPDKAQELGQERSNLEGIINKIDHLHTDINNIDELFEMAKGEDDENLVEELHLDLVEIIKKIEDIEFYKMFSGEVDENNCFLDIQSGSGGTEAQDWAEMLLRMYLRWCESKGFETELLEVSSGEVAGIKSATIGIKGNYAYGWLRTETGVHRLVRKSPFDSGSRRHTSFASVFVSPEVDDNIDIVINPSELRVDTYRASGAGGQHVNKTDSAIRITHEPTGTVVQCQNQRSQHANRDAAMKQLKSKLYELELNKRNEEKQSLEDSKSDIGWGSQIRSYVLDDQRIKDLRTGVQSSNCQQVLDGKIDIFLEESLKQGL
jgi:peptide chain release factor 2